MTPDKLADVVAAMRRLGIGRLTVEGVTIDLTERPTPQPEEPTTGVRVLRDEDGEAVIETKTDPREPRPGRIFAEV